MSEPRDAAQILGEELDEQMHWKTVVGCWPETEERFQQFYQTSDARIAEEMAQADAKAAGGELWVCAVYPGKLENEDVYAKYINPDRK